MGKVFISFLMLLLPAFAVAGSSVVSTEHLVDVHLKDLYLAWEKAGIKTTDNYLDAYSYESYPALEEVENVFKDPYISYLNVGLFVVDKTYAESAFDLAHRLYTSDPYVDDKSLIGIEDFTKPLVKIISQFKRYSIYPVYSGNAEFYSSHFSLVIVSTVTNEMLVITTGYSE